jgi:UDP-N-acetylglucosamine 2-epimerase (non-hydrolysing)
VHVEAGLRSLDRTMPEEINRLLTDAVSDLLLVSEPSGLEHLRREGISEAKIRFVGNVMIDTLLQQLPAARDREAAGRLGLAPKGYGLITLHRPSNVDNPATLARLLDLFEELSDRLPLVFPVHPRTVASARRAGLDGRLVLRDGRLLCLGPATYLDTISLATGAALVLTDSGGLQEETSVLRVPCLTLRESTERPITVTTGTSRLVGNDPECIRTAFEDALVGRWPTGGDIPLWDGRSGERVAIEIEAWLERTRT